MARFAFLALLVPALASFVGAAPVPFGAGLEKRAAFVLQDYSVFQISDGVGGDALAKANAVFIDPFTGIDLATVDATTLANIQTMREAAESAETDLFNPQIDAATGDAAAALSVGKTKNKVLKLTGEVQAINIKIAQAKAKGTSTTSLETSLAAEQKKLTNNITLDKANAGKASKGVAGGATAATTAVAAAVSPTGSCGSQ